MTGNAAPAPATDPWTVAIHASETDWTPLGAGVLIDDRRILTCAHVIKSCTPEDGVWVAFPKVDHVAERRHAARVIRADGVPALIADVVVLVLDDSAPAGVEAAPLRDPAASSLVGGDWWAFGFPNKDVFGSAAFGQVGAALGYGWTQLHTSSRYVVEQGFSGGGLWSQAYEAVVGLVGQAQPAGDNRGDGRALTLRQIATWLPDLQLETLTRWSAAASGEAALAAWGWSLEGDPEAGRHWRPRARGVSIDSERGYRFRGRDTVLAEIVDWLGRAEPDRRALVVTGSPGVGKSAVLGRVVTTADAGIRAALPLGDTGVKAPVGSIACAVHAKGKTALEVCVEIAKAASITLPDRVEDLAPALRAALEEQPRDGQRFNVVIDALDEASTPADARSIVTGIVLPLVQTCSPVGVQVLVGSRYRDNDGDLLGAFGDTRHMLDLDLPEYFSDDDLFAYALATLQLAGDERAGNPYADPQVAESVARRIARLAERNFLVAGLVARAHGLHDSEAVDPDALAFAPSVDAALRIYLDRLPPVGGVPAAAVLTVLAFAEAPGLPVSLWRIGLEALGTSLTETQLTRFARSAAANFLVESGTDNAVRCYRLFHQALNDALLAAHADLHGFAAGDQALARGWIDHGRQVGWDRALPYLLRSLPAHAAAAGTIDELLVDDAYLRYADLERLIPQADLATTDQGRQRARLLRLTPHAISAEPTVRAAMFNLTAVLERINPTYPALATSPYETVWAAVRPRTERTTLSGHTSLVRALCTIPTTNGRHILASASDDRTVRLWDPATGQTPRTLTGHTGPVNALCAVPVTDGRHLLASASNDETVRLWDPATGKTLRTLTGHTGAVNALCAVPITDGRHLLASASNDETVRLWEPTTGQTLRTLTGHIGWVRALCVVPTIGGRHLLASASGDRTVRLWEPTTGQTLHTLTGHTDWVRALCVVPITGGRRLLASASDDQTVRLWEPTTGKTLHTLTGHTGWVNALCAIQTINGRHLLASASHDQTVRLWDPATGKTLHTLTGHTDSVNALCAVPITGGRRLLASASDDQTIRLWDLASEQERVTWAEDPGWVNALCAVPITDGRHLLASASNDETVRLWDPATGQTLHTLTGHTGAVNALCAVPTIGGRRLLASASGDRTVRLWDPATGQTLRTLTGHTGWVRALCAVPITGGRRLLASASGDRTVRLWDPATGQTLRTLTGHTDWVTALCAVPITGGRHLLASASDDWTVRLWDPATGQTLRTLTGHTGRVRAICAVPITDGRHLLASASDDQTIRLWDPATGQTLHTLTGHTDWVTALCAIPTIDGRHLLASASNDQTVRLWDLDNGQTAYVVHTHHWVNCCVAVDGQLAVGLTVGLLMLRLNELPK